MFLLPSSSSLIIFHWQPLLGLVRPQHGNGQRQQQQQGRHPLQPLRPLPVAVTPALALPLAALVTATALGPLPVAGHRPAPQPLEAA